MLRSVKSRESFCSLSGDGENKSLFVFCLVTKKGMSAGAAVEKLKEELLKS